MRKTNPNNGKRHSEIIRKVAFESRQKGYSHREIAKELGISLGSAFLWTRDVVLTKEQKRDIQHRKNSKVITEDYRKRLSEIAKNRLVSRIERYTEDFLLEKIRKFNKEFGRMPLKREFNMYREYKRKFGSWNSAIRKVGLVPNPELFAHKFIAADGHKCDSFSEKIIDDWLHHRKISHERSVLYPGTKMKADFSLGSGVILEFFGLAGVQKQYDLIVEKKRKICREQGRRLIEIYPNDLFPQNQIGNLLEEAEVGF
ncbi:MAG: hypothetical protein Q8L36_02120 [bacterium]|nr:hypothetical protein [bacterium]